jgi:hypothetical protein
MATKAGAGVLKASLSEREFEVLLLRASECTKASPLRVVKQPRPAPRPIRKTPRPAA